MKIEGYKGMRVLNISDENVQIEMNKKSFSLVLDIIEKINMSKEYPKNLDVDSDNLETALFNLEKALDSVHFQIKNKL